MIEARRRVRGSGPILFLAILFVAATFLAWYFSWFGREISDADVSKYLADEKNPRHVQHALLQIQQRIERGDPGVKQWYPQLVTLSGNPETEFRLTVSWVMGFDNKSPEFHQALLKLVKDEQPIVRRNAALALVRFNDASGREELLFVLQQYAVKSSATGTIASSLKPNSQIARGALLARIQGTDGVVELRSPLPGKINSVNKQNGSQVVTGDEVLSLNSDEGSVYEALRGLALIGQSGDVQAIESYAARDDVSDRVRQQAQLTVKAIQSREAATDN
ncbi:MAG TPA: HEAT repeat domain-containing protein [Pyrinomonadaceae bacterium]|nr:HEAT repeat domain-containing protein [Pyrinomonadaceae bacterium]